MCALADEAVCIGPAPAAQSYLRQDGILEVARRTRRAGHPSRLRLPVRERRTSPRPATRPASCSSAPRRRRCATSASSTARANWPSSNGVPLLPGSGLLADLRRRAGGSGAHRLSGDAEEHGRRWRHRHAAVRSADELARAFDGVRAPGHAATSATAACSSRSSWPTRATSRCSCSAMAAARWWRWASATARCSGATRR